MSKKYIVSVALLLLSCTFAEAKTYSEIFGSEAELPAELKTLVESLDYKQGIVDLPLAHAKLNVPPEFYFLDQADAARVLTQLWGNPPAAAEGNLGMIFPVKYAPESSNSWGSVIDYMEDGYVSDIDAQATDFDALLTELKQAAIEGNLQREKDGYDPITLVGWASPPFYEKSAHTLHWARDLLFGKDPNSPHTLNYSLRILGREGVLQLNFVAGLEQLTEIKAAIPSMTKLATFDSGKAYTDFRDGDKLAAYGMAGLIAAGAGAKIAAKVGFLAIALAFLKKGGVLLFIAGAAIVRFAKGLFGQKTPPSA